MKKRPKRAVFLWLEFTHPRWLPVLDRLAAHGAGIGGSMLIHLDRQRRVVQRLVHLLLVKLIAVTGHH